MYKMFLEILAVKNYYKNIQKAAKKGTANFCTLALRKYIISHGSSSIVNVCNILYNCIPYT